MIDSTNNVLEIALSIDQARAFGRFVAAQKKLERCTIFAVVANSFVPAAGRTVVRVQFKAVGRTTAQKAIRILRSDDAKPAADPAPSVTKTYETKRNETH